MYSHNKKKCALLTIVKNEKTFLPIWLRHYKNYFNDEDIYVLNHESNDNSTDHLEVNVFDVYNPLGFDHQWLVDTIKEYQELLLESYTSVLFAEIDELIYTTDESLASVIEKFNKDNLYITQSCIGYEVCQNLEKEPSINLNENIFEQRDYWFRIKAYDKPLLTKKPLNYNWGFHTANVNKNQSLRLFLCHLHRFDFELMLERHIERSSWNLKNDGNAGFHHKISERQKLLDYFYSYDPAFVTQIPPSHKKILTMAQQKM